MISFVTIVYPRFNGNDIDLIKPFVGGQQGVLSPDVQNYINYTKYFNGILPIDSVEAPFTYRPAIPFLASLLPTSPLTGLVTINVFAALLSVLCIYFLLKRQGFDHSIRVVGCLLFIVSFPLMYYSSAGYIDASALCVICAITAATVTQRYNFLPLLFIVGALVKEVTIISVPFVLAYTLFHDKQLHNRKTVIAVGLSIAMFLVVSFLVRSNVSVGPNYVWKPTILSIQENLVRPKTYISFILTFGIVGFLAIAQVVHDMRYRAVAPFREFIRTYQYMPHIIGIGSSLALSMFAVVSAYADGRFFWTAYPFLIPPAVGFIHRKYLNSDKS